MLSEKGVQGLGYLGSGLLAVVSLLFSCACRMGAVGLGNRISK